MRILILMLAILFLVILYKKNMLVSSSAIWIGCYILIYVVTPTLRIFPNEDTIDFIAALGIILYIVGASVGSLLPRMKISQVSALGLDRKIDYKQARRMFCIVGCVVLALLLNAYGTHGIYLLLSGGMKPVDIVGGSGPVAISSFSKHLLGWAMELFQLPLILMFTSNINGRKEEKMFCFLVFVSVFLFFGYARRNLIYTILIISLPYVRRLKKEKQIIVSIFLFLSIIVGMIILGSFRVFGISNISRNLDYFIFLDGLPVEMLLEHVLSNTDFSAGYKYFSQFLGYGEIYISPVVYLKPLFVFIPRSIWSDKPSALTIQINEVMNPDFASRNMSSGMGIFGEAYAVLGDMGFVIYPLLWGLLTATMDKRQCEQKELSQTDTYFSAFYYIFSVFFIFESHRGGMADPLLFLFWCFFLPTVLSSRRTRFVINGK